MARNDVFLNINALSPADAVVTGQQDMTAATVPELVLGDTPTFNFYFTDNTNVWPSWAGNASYSLTWALSDAVAGDFAPAATTSVSTPITGGWSVVLPLNSYDLVGLLNTKRVGQPYPVQNLWQQLRVTDPSGNEITRAMFWTPVRYRAISDTQNTESATPTGGRIITTLVSNALQNPTAAQFYAANPVPTSALGTAANGELLIGNGTGFTKSTLTAGTGITVTNGSGTITIDASGAQETLTATVKNAESVAITKGQVVYLFGATGGFASVKLAYNTSDATSAKTFGVVSSTSIAANGTGTVTCVGVVDGLNLGAYNDGDTLYLGATPGSVTATKPYAPNHLVYVGIVERANAGNGELYVRVQNGYELDEIHDVQINAPRLAGQTLIYDQTNDLWKNARLTGTANQITVTNADAAVTLSIPTNPTLPGNLTVSGTGTSTFGGNLTVSGTGDFTGALKSDANGSYPGALSATGFRAYSNSVTGLTMYGRGTDTDVLIVNRSGQSAIGVPAGGYNTLVYGNLTVSGAGWNTFAGSIATTGANSLLQASTSIIDHSSGTFRAIGYGANTSTAAGFSFIGLSSNGTVGGTRFSIDSSGNSTFAGNLTVSGTGTSSFAGSLRVSSATAVSKLTVGDTSNTFSTFIFGNNSANGIAFGTGGTGVPVINGYNNTFAATQTIAVQPNGGNLLIGTTTDSGNGKLQLATHTTSAGGIGFGTDVSVYRAGSEELNIRGTNSGTLRVGSSASSAYNFKVTCSATDAALSLSLNDTAFLTTTGFASPQTLALKTAGTTALTLDSSQNATFAGSVKATTKLTIGNSAQSPSIYGSSSVTVGTTAVDLSSTNFNTGAIAVVSGYNNSGGAQGVWLIIATGGGLISTVASQNATGLTPTFSISAGKLQMSLASGSMSVVTTILGVTGL